MKAYATLTEAMAALKKGGYDLDFNLHHEWIECPHLDLRLRPEEFHIDEVHRFEGMNDPDDSEVLYAISSSQGHKGLLVDAYGVYSSSMSTEMIRKLNVDLNTQH
jgi:hypothetical protein